MIDLDFLKIWIFVRGGNDQIVAALSQNFAERLGNFRKEGVQQIGDDQAHKIRAAGHQATRRKVRTIVQLFHARENPLTSLVSDVRMVSQNLGNRDQGYSKVLRDVLHSYVHR